MRRFGTIKQRCGQQNRRDVNQSERSRKQAERVMPRGKHRPRDSEVSERNGQLDRLIAGLHENADWAVQDYVGIVLDNSVYPQSFPVEHEFTFDSAVGELTLRANVAPPESLPTARTFRFVKADANVTGTVLPKKDLKERYATARHSCHPRLSGGYRSALRFFASRHGPSHVQRAARATS